MRPDRNVGVTIRAVRRTGQPPRIRALARLLLYRSLPAALLLTSLFSMSGCIIPVAPDFQDPPDPQNYAPELSNADPQFGWVVTITSPAGFQFGFQATDPNPTDTLYVNWLVDYPPFQPQVSRLLLPDMKPPTSDGTPRSFSVTVGCLQGSVVPNTSNLHQLQAVVADRPFDISTGMLDVVPSPGKITRGNWTFYLTCSSTPGSP